VSRRSWSSSICPARQLWPGVAEELSGTKAFHVRAGAFKDVDVTLFAHVG
jgi:metal-dependent amidase/aminoacylase/carboxypeptidase family protein